VAGAHGRGVGLAEAQEALHDLLLDQIGAHFFAELHVVPLHEAPRLGAVEGAGADERRLWIGLVQVLGGDRGAGDRGAVLLDQHRHLPGRIEPQEALAPLPDLLGLERDLEPLLAQENADLAAAGIERQVIERAHGVGL
jgi:hypothetical protein